MNAAPVLSVVVPIHNEAATLPELARRVLAAAHRADPGAEVVFVDDASTDDTPRLSLPAGIRMLRLPSNRGQLGATLAGIAEAQGRFVVVLDGDLQDPPEPIPDLLAVAKADVTVDAVLMTKSGRDAPAWFHLARAAYDGIQRVPGAHPLPPGAGSYLCMRASLAGRVAQVRATQGNLAALVVGLGARVRTLPYAKQPRAEGDSKVGGLGLFREGAISTVWTGAAAVWMTLLGGCLLLAAALGRGPGRTARGRTALAGIASLCLGKALDDARQDGLSPKDR